MTEKERNDDKATGGFLQGIKKSIADLGRRRVTDVINAIFGRTYGESGYTGVAHPLRSKLNKEFEANENMLGLLHQYEVNFEAIGDLTHGKWERQEFKGANAAAMSIKEDSIAGVYLNIGPYRDETLVDEERKLVDGYGRVEEINIKNFKPDDKFIKDYESDEMLGQEKRSLKDDLELIKKSGSDIKLYKLNKERIIFDGKIAEVAYFGKDIEKINSVSAQLGVIAGQWTKVSELASALAGETGFISKLDKTMRYIGEIEKGENKYLKRLLDDYLPSLSKKRELVFKQRPQEKVGYVRFAHSYKVIKLAGIDKRTKKHMTFEESLREGQHNFARSVPEKIKKWEVLPDNVKDKYKAKDSTFYKLPWEAAPGLDDNGYPLEVDPDTGEILLDRWFHEISQNPWQMLLIMKNFDPDDYHYYDMVAYFEDKNNIRKVAKSWIQELDLLEATTHISNEWDSVRDDLRDARYHWYCKTAIDYAETDQIPTEEIKVHCEIREREIQIRATPLDFGEPLPKNEEDVIKKWPGKLNEHKIPKDEAAVKREFKIKLHPEIAKTFPGQINELVTKGELRWETDPDSKNKVLVYDKDPATGRNIRKPGHLSPGFDRRGLPLYENAIHWGRLYYYESVEGINRLARNPFPAITTRGIAKYLIDRIIRQAALTNEAKELLYQGTADEEQMAKKGKAAGYDYGLRPFGGEFTKDPLGHKGMPDILKSLE